MIIPLSHGWCGWRGRYERSRAPFPQVSSVTSVLTDTADSRAGVQEPVFLTTLMHIKVWDPVFIWELVKAQSGGSEVLYFPQIQTFGHENWQKNLFILLPFSLFNLLREILIMRISLVIIQYWIFILFFIFFLQFLVFIFLDSFF